MIICGEGTTVAFRVGVCVVNLHAQGASCCLILVSGNPFSRFSAIFVFALATHVILSSAVLIKPCYSLPCLTSIILIVLELCSTPSAASPTSHARLPSIFCEKNYSVVLVQGEGGKDKRRKGEGGRFNFKFKFVSGGPFLDPYSRRWPLLFDAAGFAPPPPLPFSFPASPSSRLSSPPPLSSSAPFRLEKTPG